jgi:hypothetical protein
MPRRCDLPFGQHDRDVISVSVSITLVIDRNGVIHHRVSKSGACFRPDIGDILQMIRADKALTHPAESIAPLDPGPAIY